MFSSSNSYRKYLFSPTMLYLNQCQILLEWSIAAISGQELKHELEQELEQDLEPKLEQQLEQELDKDLEQDLGLELGLIDPHFNLDRVQNRLRGLVCDELFSSL